MLVCPFSHPPHYYKSVEFQPDCGCHSPVPWERWARRQGAGRAAGGCEVAPTETSAGTTRAPPASHGPTSAFLWHGETLSLHARFVEEKNNHDGAIVYCNRIKLINCGKATIPKCNFSSYCTTKKLFLLEGFIFSWMIKNFECQKFWKKKNKNKTWWWWFSLLFHSFSYQNNKMQICDLIAGKRDKVMWRQAIIWCNLIKKSDNAVIVYKFCCSRNFRTLTCWVQSGPVSGEQVKTKVDSESGRHHAQPDHDHRA